MNIYIEISTVLKRAKLIRMFENIIHFKLTGEDTYFKITISNARAPNRIIVLSKVELEPSVYNSIFEIAQQFQVIHKSV